MGGDLCCVFETPTDAEQKAISEMPAIEAHGRWLRKQLKPNDEHPVTQASSQYKPSVAKRLHTALSAHMKHLYEPPRFPSGQVLLGSVICGPQHWVTPSEHLSISFTHYCGTEIRVLFSGEYIVAGVNADAIPGDWLSAKIEHLYSEPGAANFLALASNGDDGFLHRANIRV